MRLIHSATGTVPVVLDDEGLVAAYAEPERADTGSGRPWVRANFVSTLDGAATGSDGRSGSINTGPDKEVFHLLRALSDVVLVGAGTARTEGYRPAVTRRKWRELRATTGRSAHPAMAVVTRSGDVPPLLSEHRADAGEVLLVTCAAAPREALAIAADTLGQDQVVVRGEDSVDLPAAVAALAERGLVRILCEGGPHLMHDLVASGCLDELCLTLAPLLVGGEHRRILAGPDVAAGMLPHTLIEAEGSLIGRWLRP